MNRTIMQLTFRSLLGGRWRTLALCALPAVLLLLALLVRALAGVDDGIAVDLLGTFAFGTLLPLIGLIAGTGAIGSEIDDGSIAYVLAKPIRRAEIVVTKLAVGMLVALAFGALPVLLAGLVLTGEVGTLALAYAAGAVTAAIAYASLFFMLAVLTRSAVVVGLLYALVWESLVGQFVPGAKALSVQQAGASITEWLLGDEAATLGVESAVELRTGVAILVVTTVGSAIWATHRLAQLHLSEQE